MGCCPHASPDTSEGAKRGHVDLTGSQNPEQCSSDMGLESHFCVGFVLHNTGAAERKAMRSRVPVRGACGAVAQLPAGPGPEGCPGSVAEQPSPGDSSHQSRRQPRACQRSPWAERRGVAAGLPCRRAGGWAPACAATCSCLRPGLGLSATDTGEALAVLLQGMRRRGAWR